MPAAGARSPIRASAAVALVLLLAAAVLVSGHRRAAAAPFPWEHDATIELVPLGTGHAPAPIVADWNDDGRDDLVIGLATATPAHYGGIAVALRQQDGSLAPLTSAFATGSIASVVTTSMNNARPEVVDWNGDGRLDLLFGSKWWARGVFACLNAGTSAAPEIHGAECRQLRIPGGSLVGATTGSPAYVSPEAVDWDGDDDLDLLVGTGSTATVDRGVRLYENVGSRTAPALAAPVYVVSSASTPGLVAETNYEPAVVDIDDDGLLDLLIAGRQRPGLREFFLHECLNTGTAVAPVFASCTSRFLPGLINNAVDAADWDADGGVDVIRGFESSSITNPVTMFHGKVPFVDRDGDAVADSFDNCPDDPNPADVKLDRTNPVQIDTDGDGLGDACDSDDDGDTVDDAADNCPWTPNATQSDVDGDTRGDACDARDDRPTHPEAGSYEARMADRMQWGRLPVITQRADAMSIGYRQHIAEALTDEALRRDMGFTLAIITWDEARFGASPGAAYLNRVIGDPNLEVAQHGTYHRCVNQRYVDAHGPSGEEFDCGMDVAESYNLMRVGYDALMNTVDFDGASHPLTGFIPPADGYDAAAADATQALGYTWLASAYYAEPDFVHVDEDGLLHLPWSQIACGNGAATWTDCGRADIAGHSGVDCDDPAVCKPRREANPKDYSDWEAHAATSLADRCETDFERYGVCSILYELTSYDGNFVTGELDPVAFDAYVRTLDELEALAEETGAVFMTLGDYAAALQMEDTVAPTIDIRVPVEREYSYTESFLVDVEIRDDLSGPHPTSTSITLDGAPVQDGQRIDLADFSLGEHRLEVTAEDVAGNASTHSVTFTVVDDVAPVVSILSPEAGTYGHHEVLPVDVDVTDEKSGVAEVGITLDGVPVADGSDIDLLDLALGDHELVVEAWDVAGNRGSGSVTFTVEATPASLSATVSRYAAEGVITNDGIVRSLLEKLRAVQASIDRGQPGTAANQLVAFESQVRAQSGRGIPANEATLLITDSRAVRATM